MLHANTTTRTRRRSRTEPTELTDLLTLVGMGNQVANIIMQLALPPVGYGVHESRIVSGSPRRYPIKRARTTAQYLALSLCGSEDDRAVMRAAVAEAHKEVHSRPDSPVRYSGNSPDLQLWVAVCLFRYYLDQYTLMYGPLPEHTLDTLTRAAAPLGTGLNVRPSSWPQSWAELEIYWADTLPQASIDPPIRSDFESLASLSFLAEAWGLPGRLLHLMFGRLFHFVTRATLPEPFREMMGWTWSVAEQKRFDRMVTVLRFFDRILNPGGLIVFYKLYILEFRLRRRMGRPVLGDLRVSDTPIKDGAGMRRIAQLTQPLRRSA